MRQEESHVPTSRKRSAPPSRATNPPIDGVAEVWVELPAENRQQTLDALARLIAQRLTTRKQPDPEVLNDLR